MKCKFYRGPFDGKTQDINPDSLRYGTLMVKTSKRGTPTYNVFMGYTPLPAPIIETHTYEVRMMYCELNGVKYHAPATHPDGSLYLEWTKPRRRKK